MDPGRGGVATQPMLLIWPLHNNGMDQRGHETAVQT
jgi:hypothetical protein